MPNDYFTKAKNAMGETTRRRRVGTTRRSWNRGVASRTGVTKQAAAGDTVTGADGMTRVYDAEAKRWRIKQ